MEIQRIDSYGDSRFPLETLRQHGAFLADGQPCAFTVTGPDSAVIDFHDYARVNELIDEFRFYAEHITRFYSPGGRLLRQFPAVKTFPLALERVQPSQFYVDEDKLEAVGTFLHSGEDVAIPVIPLPGSDRFISLDGHTRLLWAYKNGFDHITAFHSRDAGGHIMGFVEEARSRGVYQPADLTALPHGEYDIKWNKFCDSFFGRS